MRLLSLPSLARHANRLREVLTILSKYGMADWVQRLDIRFARRLFRKRPGVGRLTDLPREKRIRLSLEELGTTFMKLGQMLSTRPDLVGKDLADELTHLQADAPKYPAEVARATIARELGRPVEEVFAAFEDVPLASASIAQVHSARLQDGTEVVVKVQHPDLPSRVQTDLDILVGLADLAESYMPELGPYRPRATAEEFRRLLVRELDFSRELRHLQIFEANFASNKQVRFPKPFPEYSTSRILTMERFEGIRLAEPQRLREAGYDTQELARRGAQIFLDMVFRDGFYHADPHPGNFLVLPGGVVGLLDCGMVGRIDEGTREQIEALLMSIAGGDGDGVVHVLMRVGAVPFDLDAMALGLDVTDFLAYYSHVPLDHFDLSGALNEMVEIVRRHHILLPTPIALLLKVLVMLEGTGRLLNPQFNLAALLRPYQRKILYRRLSPGRRLRRFRRFLSEWEHLGGMLPRLATDLLQRAQSGRMEGRIEIRHAQPAINRLVAALLAVGLFVGSAMLWGMDVGPHLWSVSVPGVLGCGGAVILGLRLLRAIALTGDLEG